MRTSGRRGYGSGLRGRRFRLFAPGGKLSEGILALVLATGLAFGAVAGQQVSIARLAVGLAGGLLLFLISMTGRLTALRLIVVWLIFLGLLRRALIPFAGWSPQDPLLLVGPAAAVMIWMSGRGEAPKRRDALAFMGLLFLIWTVGQVFNPLQESIAIGAQGVLFWLPPLIWLFVGRTFPLSVHVKIAHLVTMLAIPVAIHGLYQNFRGLLPFEYTWVGVSGFGASIFFEGFKIRPFASLTSPQEYGLFLNFALCFVWGTILAGQRMRLLRIALFVFLGVALFLQGSRSTFALFVIMWFVTSVVWTRNLAIKLALIAFAVTAVSVVKLDVLPSELGDGPIATVAEHQLNGFRNPGESTAPLHQQMIVGGFETAWKHPFGLGPGHTTIAAFKAGQDAAGTEYDMSNVFVTFGIPAGLFYVLLLIFAIAGAARRFVLNRTAYSISCLGILIATFGNIWNGGLYAVVTLIWFTLGGLGRPITEEALESREDVPAQAKPEPIYVPA